jgi:hypothetical protein
LNDDLSYSLLVTCTEEYVSKSIFAWPKAIKISIVWFYGVSSVGWNQVAADETAHSWPKASAFPSMAHVRFHSRRCINCRGRASGLQPLVEMLDGVRWTADETLLWDNVAGRVAAVTSQLTVRMRPFHLNWAFSCENPDHRILKLVALAADRFGL